MGWNPVFLGSSAAYTDLIHKLGGKAMDGLYAMHQVQNALPDDSSKNVRDWAAYKGKFNEDPACSRPTATSSWTCSCRRRRRPAPT
jgi:branched-chain amino acid transport system substrate-binding protein